jgi:hypothetical protein
MVEFTVSDSADNVTPDFRQLTVAYGNENIRVTLEFSKPEDVDMAGHNVYLYGTYAHTIRFNQDTFELRHDSESDGHFERLMFQGTVEHPSATSIAFSFPLRYAADIAAKRVWVYSQTSQDRIPDEGHLQTQ